MDRTICIMNDSFPPQIDGVANTAKNYADNIEKYHGHAVVVTPEFPDKQDYKYPYPIIRYPSLDARWFIGYMAGIPFSPSVTKQLREENIELMHCHCPAAALFLARQLRVPLNVPVVMTYHTKYDVDLLKAFKNKLLSENVVKVMISNISSCDEVWTVSRGAGENLKQLGFEGDYVIMQNGVDMPLGRVPEEEAMKAAEGLDLPKEVPLFIFVGRMMWYKGLRLILDACEGLKSTGTDFRMVFIGSGADADAIKEYSEKLNLGDKVFFAGPVYDREKLRAWYCRADVFVFPSTYDTNGLVVREAASCSLPAILVRDSCAAEGVTDGQNGFLISESAASLAVMMYKLCADIDSVRRVGKNAADELYISWKTAVDKACERYEIIIDNYKSGRYPKRHRLTDELLKGNGELMSALSHLPFTDSL